MRQGRHVGLIESIQIQSRGRGRGRERKRDNLLARFEKLKNNKNAKKEKRKKEG